MGVSVRHNSRLAAIVALVAAVMTVAWFSRALQTGSATDWVWCAVVAAVGVLQLLVVRDGRAPLMLADEHGVRVRRGETWSGLQWQDIENVEVQSPASWLRDGRIVVHPRAIEPGADDETGEAGQAAVAAESFVVPLAVTTRIEVDGLTGDLVADLDSLASGRVPVLVLTRIEPEKPEKAEKVEAPVVDEALDQPDEIEDVEDVEGDQHSEQFLVVEQVEPTDEVATVQLGAPDSETEPAEVESESAAASESEVETEQAPRLSWAQRRAQRIAARAAATVAALGAPKVATPEEGELVDESVPEPEVEVEETPEPDFDPVEPGRETLPAARSEVLRDSVRMLPNPPAIPAQRVGDGPVLVARLDDSAATEVRGAENALIGPMIAAARNRARLSIDTLSERTRIRPHVLECIEVDDFSVCGGDFYARGHLRTLARVFGLDPEELLALYDDHYAAAEIGARQVFEAELASGIGGGVRAAHTGPRWSVLAACVLALAGIWGVARVFNDQPQELVSPAPNVVDAAGLANADTAEKPKSTLAPIEVTAVGESPQVVIRDRDSRILWAGKLADGQRQQVIGMAPFDVTASNGGAVKVSYLGKPKGTVGDSSEAGSKQFG